MKQNGLTLVELLVVVTVSMLLVTGAVSLYLAFYSRHKREAEALEEAEGIRSLDRILRSDLRRLARGLPEGALTLDFSGDGSALTLRVLDTSSGTLPRVKTVVYDFGRGKTEVKRRESGNAAGVAEYSLPGPIEEVITFDSLARPQKVWFWEDFFPKGLVIRTNVVGAAKTSSAVNELWFSLP